MMPKRPIRLPLLALFAGLLLSSACSAQPAAAAPYTDGDQYVTLPAAKQQRYSNTGKVEIVEVFSYGCIHCYHFAPIAQKLAEQMPPGVVLKLLPAPFNQQWVPFARAYYAARQLGVVERTHMELFKEKFEQNYPLNSLEDLADFYARQGVNRADFMRIANSAQTTAQMKSDLALIQKWQVDGTPTLVVNGKYRVVSEHVKSQQEMADVALWLARRQLSGK